MTKPKKPWVLWKKEWGVWEEILLVQPIGCDAFSGKTYIQWLLETLTDYQYSPEDFRVLPAGRKPK